MRDLFAHDDKLIATQTCKKAVRGKMLLQVLGKLNQKVIAIVVTVGVIDGFETVDVDENDPKIRVTTFVLRGECFQIGFDVVAVPYVCQWVMVG